MKKTLTSLFMCCGSLMHAQTFTTYTTLDGLPSNNIRDVAVAPDGNIWLATQQGVARFDGTGFDVHNTTSHPGLVDNGITAIAVATNGDVWAGTDLGVSVFDGSSYTTYTMADGLGENQVMNIKQAPDGDVWIGTLNGASRYSNGDFTAYSSPDIPFGGVLHIAFDANGDVWLSGGLGGVIIHDGSSFVNLTTAQGLVSNKIRSIAFAAGSEKWVGTAKGISVFDALDQHVDDHTTPFVLPAPDTLNPITDLGIDSHGNVWAGVYVDYLVTEGGVSMYDGISWVQYELSDGLAGPNVRRLAIDADDDIWVATSTGLTEISGVPIGIAERGGHTGFGLYPVPAASEINLVLDGAIARSVEWRIFDASTRVMKTGRSINTRTSIDIADLVPGIYFMKIASSVRQFVVQ